MTSTNRNQRWLTFPTLFLSQDDWGNPSLRSASTVGPVPVSTLNCFNLAPILSLCLQHGLCDSLGYGSSNIWGLRAWNPASPLQYRVRLFQHHRVFPPVSCAADCIFAAAPFSCILWIRSSGLRLELGLCTLILPWFILLLLIVCVQVHMFDCLTL